MKSILCSIIRIDIPVSSTICLRLLNIFIASGPVTPATGSSSSSNFGSPIIERPMSTSFDWPPESSLAMLCAMCGTSNCSNTSYARARRSSSAEEDNCKIDANGLGLNCSRGGTSRFSITVICRHKRVCWKVRVNPRFWIWSGRIFDASLPKISMLPAV